MLGVQFAFFILETIAKWRQRNNFKNLIRPKFLSEGEGDGLVSQDDFDKSQKHQLDLMNLTLVQDTVNQIIDLAIWITCVPALLYQAFAKQLNDTNPQSLLADDTNIGALVILIALIVTEVKSFGFNWYLTFVVKENHGFNK